MIKNNKGGWAGIADPALSYASLIFILILIGFSFYSLHFGVPWNDEASHILPSYKYLLGQTPFIDEYNIIQLPAILTYPAFKIFYLLNHHQIDGIFIFERRLYTTIAVLCSIFFARILSYYLPLFLALLISVNLVSFAPLALHSPFYDNFVLVFLTLGAFNLFHAIFVHQTKNLNAKYHFFWAGICFGLASSIYPPLVISYFFIVLGYRHFSLKNLFYYGMGLILGISWLAVTILTIGIDKFLLALHWGPHRQIADMFHHGLITGIRRYCSVLKMISPSLLVLVIIRLMSKRLRESIGIQIILVMTIFALVGYILKIQSGFGRGMGYTVGFFLAAPFLFMFLHAHLLAKMLMRYVWIPSIISCAVVSFCSGSSGYSSIIGAFPGAMASIILMIMIFNSTTIFSSRPLFFIVISSILLVIVSYRYQLANLRAFYAEVINPKEYCFQKGSLKEICTSRLAASLITALENKLTPLYQKNKTLSILSNIEVGYFISNFNPFVDNAYNSNPEASLLYFNRLQKFPDYILIMKEFFPYWLKTDLPSVNLEESNFKAKYRLFDQEQFFTIYKKIV